MKIHLIFFLLIFVASESFSQKTKRKQELTTVFHYKGNMSVKNYDGTRSTINLNYGSATLVNADGSQSMMDITAYSSTLIAIDGTVSTVFHGKTSSRVQNDDGTQILIRHRNTTSVCATVYGNHTIMHNFGHMEEMGYKNAADILIHMNWYMQKKAAAVMDEVSEEESLD